MTDEKKNTPRMQSNSTSLYDPAKIREQAERSAKSTQQPDFSSMTLEEIQQQFYELQIKQIEAGLLIKQLSSQLEEYPGVYLTKISENTAGVVSTNNTRSQNEEKEVRREANFINALMKSIPDILFVKDNQGVYLACNSAFASLVGKRREDIIGKTDYDLYSRADADFFRENDRLMLEQGDPHQNEEWISYPDGRRVLLDTMKTPFRDLDGAVIGIIAICRDITRRRQAEDALQESEARFRLLYEKAPLGYQSLDEKGHFIQVNQTWLDTLGYIREEVIGKSFADFLHPDWRNHFKGNFPRFKAIGEILGVEFEMVKKNGAFILVSFNEKISKDKNGNFQQTHCIFYDITERKQAEEALRKSEGLLAASERLSKTGGWEWNVETQTIYWTEENYRIHDFTPGSMEPGSTEHINRSMECYEPEDRPIILAAFQRCVEEGQSYDLEFPFTTAKGHRLWIRTIACPVSESGKVIRVIGHIMDITERKQAEEALQRQLRYEQAIALASTCLLNYEDAPHKTVHDAIACLREAMDASRVYIFENSDDPTAGLCASLTHEACAPDVPPGIDNPLLQQMPYSSGMERWRELLSNKKTVWGDVCDFPESERTNLEPQGIISIMVLPLFSGGRWHGFVGFDETLKQRKWQAADVALLKTAADMIGIFMAHMRTQEALRESRERYYGVYETAPIAFVLWDRAHHITDWNRHAEKTFGWSREEALGRNFFDLILPESARASVKDVVTRLLEGLMPSRSINENIKKDGSIILCEWNNAIQYDSQGEVVGVLSLALDITEGKQAEDALRQINETLEQQVADRTYLAETRARQLQALAVELIEAEERERQRIAELLHDDLQQMLASARFQLQAANAYLQNEPIFTSVNAILEESIAISRRLSHELSPPVLYHGSLYSALEWLGRQMNEKFGLTIELKDEKSPNFENTPLKMFLFRAVQELLFNIVKHAGVKSARVKLSGSNNNITVFVTDQGKGFSRDVIDSSPEKPGFGLISIRERADRIGGHLKIESEPGQGSSFLLVLPVQAAPAEEPVNAGELFDAAVPKSISVVKRLRVLFADDHKVMRQGLIRLICAQTDIEVTGEASNGREAVELARQLRPDVIVMDISMPVMDGIEATRHIKSEFPEMRIVGLSMFEDERSVKSIIHAGADAFVPKTASPAELLEALYGNQE